MLPWTGVGCRVEHLQYAVYLSCIALQRCTFVGPDTFAVDAWVTSEFLF